MGRHVDPVAPSLRTTHSASSSLLRLAAPVAATHLANMTMQVVDTLFVGRLDTYALAGVSVGNAVFGTLMTVGIGLSLGLDYLISHAYGGKRVSECNRLFFQGLYIAIGYSVAAILAMQLFASYFGLFGISPEIASQAESYLRSCSLSLLPFLVFTSMRQYLQATGSAMPMLYIVLAGNVVNAFFNWILIFGNLGSDPLGVLGAGIATTIARAFMFLALLGYLYSRNLRSSFALESAPKALSWPTIRSILTLGAPAAGMILLEVGVFSASTLFAGRLGAVPIAAHQIVLQVASFTFMVPLGISSAAAVLVGQSMGAEDPHRATRLGWHAFVMGVSVMAFFALVMIVGSQPLLGAFTHDAAVIATATSLLFIAALFQISDGAQTVLAGALRGTGNTRSPLWANLIGHWFVGFPLGLLLCYPLGLGVTGVWIGLSAGLTVVALALLKIWRNWTFHASKSCAPADSAKAS